MSSVNKLVAYNGAISGASGEITLSLEAYLTDLIPTIQVSALGAGTALSCSFQHSPDGTFWDEVVALETTSGGASLNVAGILLKPIVSTNPVYGNVKFSWALTGGTTTATAIFSVYCDKRK